MDKFKTWLKAHRTLATLISLSTTVILLGIIFAITGWALSGYKPFTVFHLVFFGFYGCILAIFAIQANHWFQKWLLKP
jgi:hypothetical protein